MILDIILIISFFAVLNKKIISSKIRAAVNLDLASYTEYFIYMVLCIGCLVLAFQKEYSFLTFSGYSLMIRWGCIITGINLLSISFVLKCLIQPNNNERLNLLETLHLEKIIKSQINEYKSETKDVKREIAYYNKKRKQLEKQFRKDIIKLNKTVSSKEELLEKAKELAIKYEIKMEDN